MRNRLRMDKEPLQTVGRVANPDYDARKPSRVSRWRGWHVSVIGGALLSLTILVLNICVLAWAQNQKYRGADDESGSVTVYRGDCKATSRAFTWSHLAINAMSTLLLSASTVGVQCSSAPTRNEVDRAHAAGEWLHIGVVGYRNWRWITRARRVIWVVLMVSSLPLHLV